MFNNMQACITFQDFFLMVTAFKNEKLYERFNMNINFFFELCETCQIILESKVPKIVQFDKSRQYIHVLDYVLQEIRLMIEKATKLKYLKLPRFPTHF